MSNKGFTLVELLVTVSVFTILTGVVLYNQSKFNGTILLTSLAYDTALTVRQAQTYGINIRSFNYNGENIFTPYGVHFQTNEPYNKSFILFSALDYNFEDINSLKFGGTNTNDCIIEDGCVSRYNIQRGNYVSDICLDNTENCGAQSLDVFYVRPNPEAIIKAADSLGSSVSPSKAIIKLSNSENSFTREVVVQSNGLIYVKSN